MIRFFRERRPYRFPESLSRWMFIVAALGSAWVLIDPYIAFAYGDWAFKIGGIPFSAEIKGAVVTIGILGLLNGIKSYWLPTNNTGQKSARASDVPEADKPEVKNDPKTI